MAIDRRTFITAAIGAAAFGTGPARAQRAGRLVADPVYVPPQAPLNPIIDEVAARAAQNRRLLSLEDGRFGGDGWDRLLAAGRESQFFMIGEEHGIAENPALAAALFHTLSPAGYQRAAIETSPQAAFALDAAARGGMEGLTRHFGDARNTTAFFGMRQEAAWLAAVRRVVPGSRPALWGLDYEVAADRRLIADLTGLPKPAPAASALVELAAASADCWSAWERTRDPARLPGFSLDPALVQAVRTAWPRVPEPAAWALDTLEETFAINALWRERRGFESNLRRAALMRRNFLRHWRAEPVGRKPRVMLKFGLFHMMRGLSMTNVFDLGTLVPELAEMEGGKAFQLCVLPGATSSVAQLNPADFSYNPRPIAGESYVRDLEPLYRNVLPDGFTLFDTAPLRPLMERVPASNRTLPRIVFGFDAVLLMSGSTPATNLRAPSLQAAPAAAISN